MSKTKIIGNQIELFAKLKQKFEDTHPGRRFSTHLADYFNVNEESVRRWTKGISAVDLDMVEHLCKMHHTTLLELHQYKLKGKLNVDFNFLDDNSFTFEHYLQNLAKTLEVGMNLPKLTMHYSAKDLPIFYYFNFKELAAFKVFVWRKTVICEPEFRKQAFSPTMFDNTRIMEYGQKALSSFNKIHTVEVWNDETVNSIIKQILYFTDMQEVDPGMGELLLQQLKQLIEGVEEMAEWGQKFDIENPHVKTGSFELFYNDIVLCDNSVVLDMGEAIKTFIPFQTLNLMQVNDYEFGKQSLEKVQQLQKRFDKLSQTNEGQRKKIFGKMRASINKALTHIS